MMIYSFIKINPHLSGPSPGKPGHLHWDVTQPPSTAQLFFGENETLSFDQFCDGTYAGQKWNNLSSDSLGVVHMPDRRRRSRSSVLQPS